MGYADFGELSRVASVPFTPPFKTIRNGHAGSVPHEKWQASSLPYVEEKLAVQTYFASIAPFHQYQFYSICKGCRVNRSAHTASDLEIFPFPSAPFPLPSALKRSAHFSVVGGVLFYAAEKPEKSGTGLAGLAAVGSAGPG